jgi:hypothetical protein
MPAIRSANTPTVVTSDQTWKNELMGKSLVDSDVGSRNRKGS